MADILKRTKASAQRLLTELATELQQQRNQELEPLQKRLQETKLRLENLQEVLRIEHEHNESLRRQQQEQFQLADSQMTQLREIWQLECDKYFTDAEQLQDWVKGNLATLEGMQGEILSGKSFPLIKKLLSKREASFKLTQDPSMQQPGFLLIGDGVMIDATLETYLEQKFERYQRVLIETLFDDV